METNHLLPLATERVGKLMGRYVVPCVISLLVGALYNIVDQIFIANAAYLGSYGNAANTVVFPLTVIVLAIAVMIGTAAVLSSVSVLARASQKTLVAASETPLFSRSRPDRHGAACRLVSLPHQAREAE